MTINIQDLTRTFQAELGEAPSLLVRAPGRVNLIGEHTDYNDGFVLPIAIDRAIWLALRPRGDRSIRIYSRNEQSWADFSLDALKPEPGSWGTYAAGTAAALQTAGYQLAGWEGVLEGDIPRGAGLSSSAALEMAVARACQLVADFEWEPVAMARAGQLAENHWVGVNTGIMDQMISADGVAGHAVLIDCRSLERRAVPLPEDAAVIVLDTRTRRGLVDSLYDERRRQCEAAAAHFGVPALRDVTEDAFAARAAELDPAVRRRARHVVTENARVLAAEAALIAGDAATFGALMNESHVSMRDDFENSRAEMDTMVALAQAAPGCYGARMTGGGFGGCAVALVDRAAVPTFTNEVTHAYAEATGLTPALIPVRATAGAAPVPLP